MPCQKGYVDDTGGCNERSHFLEVDAIHPRRQVLHAALKFHHLSRLRWIQEDMRICTVELGKLRVPYCNLRYTRATLAKKTVSCKPWGGSICLDILPETNINGILVFGYLTFDVVEPAVADLDIDIASEYQFQETYKWRYHFFCTAGKV